MSTYFSLGGFEASNEAEIEKIDARQAKSTAPGELSYNVKKSLDMGWQIATGADKQSFNATYSTMPADVAAKVGTWSALPTPSAPKPAKTVSIPVILAGVGIAGVITVLGVKFAHWWFPKSS